MIDDCKNAWKRRKCRLVSVIKRSDEFDLVSLFSLRWNSVSNGAMWREFRSQWAIEISGEFEIGLIIVDKTRNRSTVNA
jgi:hypothetical protein